MSKIVYMCFNNKKIENELASEASFQIVSDRLTPDNIEPNPVKSIRQSGIAAAVINHVKSVQIKDASICLGTMMKPYDEWYKPLAPIPDGNYALFRGDKQTVEVITDVVASRTIWYYFDENIFIASTSQRAIVIFLRSFSVNHSVIPWMLPSGRLGYGNSWDSRIKILKGDSRLILDRLNWKLTVNENPVIFNPKNVSIEQSVSMLKEVYIDTLDRMDFGNYKWILTLSGGHDSRILLLLLQNKEMLSHCVTWGIPNAINDTTNDAYIAHELAKYFNIEHKYYEIITKENLIDDSLNRLLVAGEGRRDSINAYMDGLETWRCLFKTSTGALMRGDIGLNSRAIVDPEQGRRLQGITLLSDYKKAEILSCFGFEQQEIHPDLSIREKESLISYSFRLHHIYNIPYHLAALSDIKLSYVEIANPLLTREIVYTLRTLPVESLYMKNAHKRLVSSLSPDIPFASSSADEPIRDILYNSKIVEYIKTRLMHIDNNTVFSEEFINLICRGMKIRNSNDSAQSYFSSYSIVNSIKRIISTKNKQKWSAYLPRILDLNTLALRSYIIVEMYRLLQEDARIMSTKIYKNRRVETN
jgi:hypothetical protein